MLAFKIDNNGSINWTKTIGGASEDVAYDIIKDNSNGYMLGGYTKSFGYGNNDIFITRLDNNGTPSWSRATGGSGIDGGAGGPNYKTFRSLISAGGSRLMIADYTQSYGAGMGDIIYGVADGSGNFASCPDTAASTGITSPNLLTSSPIVTATAPIAYTTTASPTAINAPLSTFLICGCNNLVDLGPDTSICIGDSLVLDAGPGYTTYLWQDASNAQTLTVYNSGYYSVTTTDANGCVYIDSVLIQALPPPFVDLGPDVTICEGTQLTLNAGIGFSAYKWNNNATTQTINAAAQGIYSVTVTNVCGQDADSMQILSVIPAPKPDLGNDTVICSGGQLILDPGTGFSSYHWQDNSTGQAFLVSASGLYSVTVTNLNNCSGADTIYVGYKPVPVLDLGDDITLCDKKLPIAFELNNSYNSYKWQDGSTSPNYTATKAGTYSVTITDDCGTITDEVVISPCPACVVDIPSGFSPNGDGVNDIVHVLGSGYTEANLQIFDRQGQLLYESADPGSGWDGTFKGAPQGIDVYVYHLTATCRDGKKKDLKGNITLVR
jgi:gliding motility-associated-like protein